MTDVILRKTLQGVVLRKGNPQLVLIKSTPLVTIRPQPVGRMVIKLSGSRGQQGPIGMTGPAYITDEVVTCTETIEQGDLLNVCGDNLVRRADARFGYAAQGFALQSGADGDTIVMRLTGKNAFMTGLTGSNQLWLSTDPGKATTSSPSSTGQISQKVGVAFSATSMIFEPEIPITL